MGAYMYKFPYSILIVYLLYIVPYYRCNKEFTHRSTHKDEAMGFKINGIVLIIL